MAVTAVGVAVILLATRPDCRPDRFGPGSGDGRDPGRPLLVDSPAALAAVATCPDRHLRQVADLEAPNPWTPIGLAAGAAFTGSYDGGGHRLTGLRVFLPGAADAGMFAVVDGGEVRDLVLVDVVVEAGDRTGAVAGRVGPTGRIRGVTVRDARVVGGADVGGLVGLADPAAVVDGTFEGRIGGRVTSGGTAIVGRVGDPVP